MNAVFRAAAVAVLAAATACGGSDTPDVDVDAVMADALEALELSEVDDPEEVVSKDISYLATTGVADGDVADVADDARDALDAAGFTVDDPVEVPGGLSITASRDGVTVSAAAYAQVGVNPAPEGSSWVRVRAADNETNLAWTR
ncbi:MAG: hypothetical protein U5K29_00345 [Acidimicrobiales bacterium]|nr:hypothetical protein [Acidimicrobiales bacterium]